MDEYNSPFYFDPCLPPQTTANSMPPNFYSDYYAPSSDYIPGYTMASDVNLSGMPQQHPAPAPPAPPPPTQPTPPMRDHPYKQLSRTESMSPLGQSTRSPRGRPRQETDDDGCLTESQRIQRQRRDYARGYREKQRKKAEEAERLNNELHKKKDELQREILEKRQILEELNRAREEMENWKMRYLETNNQAQAQMLRITELERSNAEYRMRFGDPPMDPMDAPDPISWPLPQQPLGGPNS